MVSRYAQLANAAQTDKMGKDQKVDDPTQMLTERDLEGWIKDQGKSVTKESLVDFINTNQVQVVDVLHGGAGQVDMGALEDSLGIIAEHISPKTLVLIETTVAQCHRGRFD